MAVALVQVFDFTDIYRSVVMVLTTVEILVSTIAQLPLSAENMLKLLGPPDH